MFQGGTIDAMGCQSKIAAKIVDERADYCLTVKGNQPALHAGNEAYFLDHLEDDFARPKVSEHHTKETGLGRIDERRYYLSQVPADLPDAGRWKDLRASGLSINITQRRKGDEIAVCYDILNKMVDGELFASALRGHWGIENSCDWQLDVTFGDDDCRIRKGHGDKYFSAIRRTVLSLFKQEKTAKCGIKSQRLATGWGNDYMEKVLFDR